MGFYRYDEIDQRLVEERASQFRDQVARRLSGELSEEEFRPLRLMNGLYLQLHAYMLRVAIPYGTLSAEQMRTLAHIARRYDRGYGHFTTRQNIQFNWPKLDEVPDLLDDLAAVQMHAIQTSGNCIRNVTADPLAGVAADELEDARIYGEVLRQWSTFHPEFSFLPRKFKIAVNAASEDRAALRAHDIGLQLRRGEGGRLGFEVMVGGGQGRTPILAETLHDFLPVEDLLPYVEAIMRVYNRHGRRDNIYKARIKILVKAIGIEAFREQVEAEWRAQPEGELALPADELERIRAFFEPRAYPRAAHDPAALARAVAEQPAFGQWLKRNVAAHREPDYAIAQISLKPAGGIPGDATAAQMELVADLAERYGCGEIRVTHRQNLVLPDVPRAGLLALWRALDAAGLGSANYGLIGDIIACPGLDFCNLANARSIPVAQALGSHFADLRRQHDIGDLSLNISGCINACGHHHVANIGILGVDKKGVEFYQITLGGAANQDAALGDIVGAAVPADRVVDAVDDIVAVYLAERQDGETFLQTYRRIGLTPFKEKLYAVA